MSFFLRILAQFVFTVASIVFAGAIVFFGFESERNWQTIAIGGIALAIAVVAHYLARDDFPFGRWFW